MPSAAISGGIRPKSLETFILIASGISLIGDDDDDYD